MAYYLKPIRNGYLSLIKLTFDFSIAKIIFETLGKNECVTKDER